MAIFFWGSIGLLIGNMFFTFIGKRKFLNEPNSDLVSKAKEYPELALLLKVGGWKIKDFK